MSDGNYEYKNSFKLMKILLFFIYFFEVNSSCKITVPESVTSQKLNNLICIGTINFKYPNFATFSNGSLIIETSEGMGSERVFYGITKEGKPLFANNQYVIKFNISEKKSRQDSENFIININDEEYLMSIGNRLYMELYNLYKKEVISISSVTTLIGESDIMDSYIQTGINYFENNKHYLIYGYETQNLFFYLKKLYFGTTNLSDVSIITSQSISPARGFIASCFMTKNKYISCIILKEDSPNVIIRAYVYNTDLMLQYYVSLGHYVTGSCGFFYCTYPFFIKCIHLKDEIGVYAFYVSSDNKKPYILFRKVEYNKLSNYINSDIILNKKEMKVEHVYNDLIKINENKICFISTTNNLAELIIVLLSIYNSNNVAIRYYIINVYSLYNFKFKQNLRANLYNNFISFAFSFFQDNDYYTGLMFFSYPNGQDHEENLIEIMLIKNEKIENILINLNDKIVIDNNIFGLVYHNITINDLIGCNLINLNSQKNNMAITNNYLIEENEIILAEFEPLNKIIQCSINYFYYISEPNFEEYNSFVSEKVFPLSYNERYFEQEKDIYKSRLLYYNITIKEELTEDCQDEKCLLCKKAKKLCIVCKYNYLIKKDSENEKYKQCVEEGVIITNQNYLEESIKSSNIENNDEENNKNEEEENENENNDVIDIGKLIIFNTIGISCSLEDMIQNNCPNIDVTQIKKEDIFNKIQETYLNPNYDGKEKTLNINGINYELSTFEEQKNSNNSDISIDLGDCEQTLREYYNITSNKSLIQIKSCIKNKDNTLDSVHFEVYNPENYEQLNISICTNKIIIESPIDLNEETISLYQELQKYNYNLFDPNDNFYNDVCSLYTTPKGTDMIIEERKNKIYSKIGNITLCQTGCEFISYNITTKKVKCSCEPPQVSIIESFKKIDFDDFDTKKIGQEFTKTIKNSNLQILKCHHMPFNIKTIFKNIGCIIMSIIYLLFLISFFIFIIKFAFFNFIFYFYY